jgi:hypothetical protein
MLAVRKKLEVFVGLGSISSLELPCLAALSLLCKFVETACTLAVGGKSLVFFPKT